MVRFTDIAREKVLGIIRSETRKDLALRFAIQGRGPGGFQYRLGMVGPEEKTPEDRVVDAGGFDVYIDPQSASSLEGVTVDFVEEAGGSGFKIDNPNPLWSDPTAQAVHRVLEEEINPAVAQHGGWVTLLDVKDDVVYVQLGGGCQGCGMVDVTLRQGIEVRLRQVIPGIREVVDTTDHAGGTNPYYRPSKGGGHSPFAG